MFKTKLKKLSIIAITIFLTLGFSVSLQSLLAAWTTPTTEAPGNNIIGPLNVGNIGQSKNAGLIVNAGSISENGLIVQSGKVGIGTLSPASKFEVNGEVRIGTTGQVCSATTSGAIRYNGSDFEGCKGGSWVSLTSGGVVLTGASSTVALYEGIHTEGQCYIAGGEMKTATDGTSKFCKLPVSTCPTGWTNYLDNGVNWSQTENASYPGGGGCQWLGYTEMGIPYYDYCPQCFTGSHVWSRNNTQERCGCYSCGYYVYAPYTYRGCY